VSSEIHINGGRVSESVQKDKGKVTVLELEEEKDPKRARMVLSEGHEVVRPGYSWLSGDAARAADKGEDWHTWFLYQNHVLIVCMTQD
jgi:hypothetical protein